MNQLELDLHQDQASLQKEATYTRALLLVVLPHQRELQHTDVSFRQTCGRCLNRDTRSVDIKMAACTQSSKLVAYFIDAGSTFNASLQFVSVCTS